MVLVYALPPFAALLSNKNKKYLSYVKEEGEAHKHLGFSSEEIVSRSTKFELERSSKHKKLIHLRCCHNNKYLVKKSQDDDWIVAASEKAEEDQSLWSSTLFEPVIVENQDGYGRTVVRFMHVQTESYLSLSKSEGVFSDCLYLSPEAIDLITVIDWATLVIFPKLVAFKSSKYLISSSGSDEQSAHPRILSCCDDKSDTRVFHEVVTNSDGTVRVKCCDADGFWTSNADGKLDVEPLITDENASKNEIFQAFTPIKISSTEIALRCAELNKFCIIDSATQQLCCNANCILRETRFQVQDLVISREVYDIKYHLQDSRIYDVVTQVVATSTEFNNRKDAHLWNVTPEFEVTSQSSWTNSSSLSSGLKMNISARKPNIEDNVIRVEGSIFAAEYEWGEMVKESSKVQVSSTVDVAALTKAIHRVVMQRGKCDVPFSYTMREVFIDGNVVVSSMDDGVYTGMNYYNTQTQTEFISLVV